MNKALLVSVLSVSALATALASTVSAQGTREFLGRWDMTVTPADGKSYPQWMELTDDGGKIIGRVQPRGGAWHTITDAKMESGKLIVLVQEASSGPAMSWELTSPDADRLTGIETRGDAADGSMITGVKAPVLDSTDAEEVDAAEAPFRRQGSQRLGADWKRRQ